MAKNTNNFEIQQRLEEYRLFSPETIKTVVKVASRESDFETYKDYFKSRGVGKPFVYKTTQGDGVPVIDIPATSKKHAGVLVMHLPMANPLDPNQLFQAVTIAAVNPRYRVIAFGNPSGAPYSFREQNLTWRKRFSVAFGKNKQALVAAEQAYLQSQGINGAVHTGYSYGAHKALVTALVSKPESVEQLILIDPVAHSRGFKQLTEDFQRTSKDLNKYVERTHSKLFTQARHDSAQSEPGYKQFIRPISISIAIMMARLDFVKTLTKVVSQRKNMRTTVAWGTKSELGNDAHIATSLQYNSQLVGRVQQFRLVDDVHALANDIYLHAAIIREAL